MQPSKALYVYGVVSNRDRDIAAGGIGSEPGVLLFPFEEIAALVSEVDTSEFGQGALARNLKNPEWVKDKIWTHEKVLERVMNSQAVIPMKFGALFSSEERLGKALAQSYSRFRELLEKLEGQVEYSVKVYGDSQILKAKLGKTSGSFESAACESAAQSKGLAYLLQRKREQTLNQKADEEKVKRLQELFDRLLACSTQGRLGDLSPRELTGKDTPMIVNAIFLVAKEGWSAFSREVARLGNEMAELRWEVQLAGPFPPYNFIEWPSADEVQE